MLKKYCNFNYLFFLCASTFLFSCNQQTKQQDNEQQQDCISTVLVQDSISESKEMVTQPTATEQEDADLAEQLEWLEDAAQTDAEWEANQAAAERAKNEEMLSKLYPIEEEISRIRNEVLGRKVQKVLTYRRDGTSRYSLDYGSARQSLLNTCVELKNLYKDGMSIAQDYGRNDIAQDYVNEIYKVDCIIVEAIGEVETIR